MPPTASKLGEVPIPRKVCGKQKRRVEDDPALDEEQKTYPLQQDVVKEAPACVNWERLDILECIGFGQYQNAKLFSLLSVNGREFSANSNGLTR